MHACTLREWNDRYIDGESETSNDRDNEIYTGKHIMRYNER